MLGVGVFVAIRLLKWPMPRSPGPLVAVVLGTLLSFAFDLESFGIALLGKIPATLPGLTLDVPSGSRSTICCSALWGFSWSASAAAS